MIGSEKEKFVDDFYSYWAKYDIKSGKWTEHPLLYPGMKFNHMARAIQLNNTQIMITGGFNPLHKKYLSAVYVLNTTDWRIESRKPLKFARWNHSMVMHQDKPVVIGGYSGSRLNSVEKCDGEEWSEMP